MNLTFLKEKKGPLPVWAWALVVAVAVFGIYYLYKRRSGSTSTSSNATPTDTGTGTGTDTGSGSDSGGGGGAGLGFPDQTTPLDGLSPYWVGTSGGGGDPLNLVSPASSPSPDNTAGIPSTSSPVKPAATATKSVVTAPLFRQVGESLGSTTAPPAVVAAASERGLKAAQKAGESPATAALAARSAGLNAAYGIGESAPKNGVSYFTYKKDAVKAANGKTVKFKSGKGYYVA